MCLFVDKKHGFISSVAFDTEYLLLFDSAKSFNPGLNVNNSKQLWEIIKDFLEINEVWKQIKGCQGQKQLDFSKTYSVSESCNKLPYQKPGSHQCMSKTNVTFCLLRCFYLFGGSIDSSLLGCHILK